MTKQVNQSGLKANEKENKQVYRSGHNEAVLKTVWGKLHGGSNPSACATTKATEVFRRFCCTYLRFGGGFEGRSRFARAKRFALRDLGE